MDDIGAIAAGYDSAGQVRRLVPIIGMGCPHKLQWQDQNGALCGPPKELEGAWREVSAWLEFHAPSQSAFAARAA